MYSGNTKIIEYYQTFEEREESVRNSVFSLVPRKHIGPKNFWLDIEVIAKNIRQNNERITFITSNPCDCLAFGTPFQILRASYLSNFNYSNECKINIEDVCSKFLLSKNLTQYIHTLSGGELVRLALAKAYIRSFYSDRLVIASPFNWLNSQNFNLIDTLVNTYLNKKKKVQIFALEGEDDFSCDQGFKLDELDELRFKIIFEDVSVLLNFSDENENSISKHAYIANNEFCLTSPCLLCGGNGSGKSMISYILSNSIQYNGSTSIITNGLVGSARIVFQEVLLQTLLRSFDRIVLSAYNDQKKIVEIYENILREVNNYFNVRNITTPLLGYKDNYSEKSLFQTKAILSAVRISSNPALIILDEPDWGLSKNVACALVYAISKIAHSNKIPIMIISHRPWWNNIIQSVLKVNKLNKSGGSFNIDIKEQKGNYVEEK